MFEGLEPSAILDEVVQYTTTLLACDEASVVLWNTTHNNFELGAATNRFDDNIVQKVRREGGATRWIIDNKTSLVVNNIDENPVRSNELIEAANIKAYIGMPILYNDKILGVLYALSQKPDAFTDEHVENLRIIARMAAIAIVNARLATSLTELNAFKDAMMGLAAHDLRNPLSRVVGYFDVLIDDLSPLNEDQESWVERIRYAVNQMADLIDGILHYANITHQSDATTFEEGNLNDIATETVGDFVPDAETKQQSLELTTTDRPLNIRLDRLLIKEALGNLISNAIKYSEPGKTIHVETRAIDHEFQIAVDDEGPGIELENHNKVFEPFTRLPDAKSQRGTGLGLSLVKLIVEQHGGYVSLHSQPGTGSSFRMHFPVAHD
jgi:signal transduction histidine kinase